MPETESKRAKASARRRRHILDAAITGFLENGYHQTGMREIARRAEVSLGNLYNHFSGKTEVLAEIAAIEREDMAPILALLSAEAPADKLLEEFVKAYATSLASREIAILTLEITCEAVRQPDIAALFTDSRAALINALAGLIRRGIDGGQFRPVPDMEETAHLILQMIEGSAYRIALEGAGTRRVLNALSEFARTALAARSA